jgi:isopenicillin-N epimerase
VSQPRSPAPIAGARLLFSLDPAIAHLNHGSFGAVPINVQRAQQRLRDEVESNPLRFYAVGLKDRIAHTRRHLASFLGADPDGTALVGNTTAGIGIVLQSVKLAAGDEIVTTDQGYGSIDFAIGRECARTGATARKVAVPLRGSVDEIVAAVTAGLRPGRTKLLIVDEITSAAALRLPVGRIVAAAHDAGIPVAVDGAHAPGMLPVDVSGTGADFWVGNFHKWAYAPRGTAVLAVAPAWRERIEPLVVSWEQPTGFPARVEWQATLDYTPWLAAPIGLFTMRNLGVDAVRAHNVALAAYGQAVVGAALDVPPDDLPDPGPGVSMRLVPLPAGLATDWTEAAALRQRIADDLATEVSITTYGGRGWLRLSAHVYNRADEYDRLAERLPAYLAGLR